MSAGINKLPPPWPNAALALSRVAVDAQLREQVDQASSNAPIKTGLNSKRDEYQAETPAPDASTAQASTAVAGNSGVDIKV